MQCEQAVDICNVCGQVVEEEVLSTCTFCGGRTCPASGCDYLCRCPQVTFSQHWETLLELPDMRD
jgi:hypothetical protein